jgi:hypothetical protein
MLAESCCPTRADLERLLLGTVPSTEAEQLERHLAGCPNCLTVVRELHVADALTEAVERAPTVLANGPEEAMVPELIERIITLGKGQPTTAPQASRDLPEFPCAADGTPCLGPYHLREMLGSGGMGVVYLADDTHLRRLVAIKVLRPSLAANPVARERFLREARAAAALEHDHIVTIHHVGEADGVPFLVMPLLRGETLEQRLQREKSLTPAETRRVGREVAAALAAAHEHGLIHRDIKPSNIWLEAGSGRVKLLDFGLARAATGEDQLTETGLVVGTPAYMAPEQARGDAVDGRSDLFSLGCVLYRALTGHSPFKGPDALAILSALATCDPRPARELAPHAPPTLVEVVMKLLAKKPADRYPTARAALEALDGHDGPPPNRPRQARRRLLVVAVGLLLLLGGVTLVLYELVFKTPEGTLMVQIDDADVEARFKQGELQILDASGAVRYSMKPNEKNRSLPPGQWTIQVRGADGLTVDTPEFTLRKGERIPVRVMLARPPSGSPSTPPAQPAPSGVDKERPFVIVRTEGDRLAFKTLHDALVERKTGDAIEVHDNGPFHVPAAELHSRGLILRAASGYRPVFVAQIEEGARRPWLAILGGEVLVEGCDFHGRTSFPGWFLDSGPEPKPAAPWTFRKCRFWVYGARGLIACAAPRLRLEDCLFIGAFDEAFVSLAPRADLEMTNNLVWLGKMFAIVASGNQVLRATNNTFDLGSVPWLRPPLDEASARQVTVIAEGNAFWGCRMLAAEEGGTISEKVTRLQVKWQGQDNLYVRSAPYVSFAQDQRVLNSLDDWNRFWGRVEPGSIQTSYLALQIGSIFALERRLALKTARAEVEALGRRLGAGASNVGPEWELVGPGDACVAARERASGKLILKEQLRPQAPAGGPFVLLRNQEPPLGHATLQSALDAAQEGDVIEVRSDGPFPGASLKAPERAGRLTIRAAPGYQPALQSSFRLELPKADVEIEGLAFQDRGGLLSGDYGQLTLRNCALWGWEENTTTSCVLHGRGQAARFINSIFNGGPVCSVGPGQSILFENCMMTRPSINARADDDDCEMVIRRSLCWPYTLGSGTVACDLNPRAQPRVHAEDSVFVGGGVLTVSAGKARWSGAHNVYSLTAGFAVLQPFYTLEAWQKRWDSDRDSLFTLSPFLEPRMWRFMPGQPKRPDGRDYGADVDKIATPLVAPRTGGLVP